MLRTHAAVAARYPVRTRSSQRTVVNSCRTACQTNQDFFCARPSRLQETIDHLRADIEKVDKPQLKAMFETAAEVLGGLKKAFSDYEQKNETAWRR